MASPIGAMVPAMASLASVVGLPEASNAQPAGIGSLAWAATLIRPRATLLRLMSMTSGGSSARGAANPIGLVPNSPRWPPHGAMAWGPLPTLIAMKPARARGST